MMQLIDPALQGFSPFLHVAVNIQTRPSALALY